MKPPMLKTADLRNINLIEIVKGDVKSVLYKTAYSNPQKTFKFTHFERNDFWDKNVKEKWWVQMKGGIMGYEGDKAYSNAEIVQKLLKLMNTYDKNQICFDVRLMNGTKIKKIITNCKVVKATNGYTFKLVPTFIGKESDVIMPLSDSY